MRAGPDTVPETTGPDVPPWPAAFAERYRAVGYWRDLDLGSLLWSVAAEHRDRTALVAGAHRLTYRQLTEHADTLAEALHTAGLRRGDRIVLQLPNCWEFVAVLLACLRAGVVPVLALVAHREHELRYLVQHTGAQLLVVPDRWRGFDHEAMAAALCCDELPGTRVAVVGDTPRPGHLDLRAMLRPHGDPAARRRRLDAAAPAADDLAFFLLSGGTTGQPKLIGRTHNDYEYACRRMAQIVGADRDTVYLVTLPAAHNFPLGGPGILGVLAVGGRVVMLPSPEPVAAFEVIAAESPTITSLVPAVAQRWAEHAADRPGALRSLRVVQVGGSVLDPAVAAALQASLGARLQQVFGMAEGLLCCTRLDDADATVFGTQGRPVSAGDEIRIVGESGHDVPDGTVGELLTRGPYTPRGYYRAPAFNALRFTPDGWYHTGDLVHRHASGNLVVAGRSKDLVNRGGEKVSAEEVETLARDLLRLRDVAVVAVPDARYGERVCLVTTPGPNGGVPALEELRQRLRAHGVAHYKLPEQLEVMPALPLTPIGKIDKVAVRAHINGEHREG